MERFRARDWLVESDTGVMSVERNAHYRNVRGPDGKWESVRNEESEVTLSMKLLRRMEHEAGISTKRNQHLAKQRREKMRTAAMAGESAAVARPFGCHCNRVFERWEELKSHAQESHLSIHERELQEKGGDCVVEEEISSSAGAER